MPKGRPWLMIRIESRQMLEFALKVQRLNILLGLERSLRVCPPPCFESSCSLQARQIAAHHSKGNLKAFLRFGVRSANQDGELQKSEY